MVMPALDSQIAELAKLRPAASHDAGVWRLPDGERYYAASLGIETTTDLAAADLHQLGLALAADLQSQLAGMLKAQGSGRDNPAASRIRSEERSVGDTCVHSLCSRGWPVT